MPVLLLEIGTEELPPGVIANSALELKHRVTELLQENGLGFEKEEVFFTPRRLTVRITGLPITKPASVVELLGPPKSAGFDREGKPTKTAIGFASAHGKRVEDLYVKTTPRGDYIFVKKELPPLPTREILLQNLPRLIITLPFPKTMRWQEGAIRFSRPIRWLLCVLDEELVPLEIDGLVAGNKTFGHRNFSNQPIFIPSPDEYERLLEKYKVIVCPKRRAEEVIAGINTLSEKVGGEVVEDPELIEATVNTTEFPFPILGEFNSDYLSLPREVLITALKMHQRCFSIQDKSKKLLPYFIAVTNSPECDQALVRSWYERAIDSRLRDARFFVEADLKTGLEPLVEKEKEVVWIEGLGSYYDKTQRLRELCRYLSETTKINHQPALLDRAALLCKTDLLSQLVREKEFTSLQGVAGGIYARLLGEPEEVAWAISEHYQPKGPEDKLPKTIMGGILSIADKIDNIVATYLTGETPTGSEDPFGVRRQATGVLLIILKYQLPVAISELVDKSLTLFREIGREIGAVRNKVLELFRERLSAVLEENGIRYDVANAVLRTVWHTPHEALARAQALSHFRTTATEFERLVIGQKRVANILRGQEVTGLPDPTLFTEEAEFSLYNSAQKVENELNQRLTAGDYQGALILLLSLRPEIDRLFDDVLIMHEEEKLRLNRLRLLSYLRSLFARVADLSEIVLD